MNLKRKLGYYYYCGFDTRAELSTMSKRRDPFGGSVGKSNNLPQRHVHNETLNRLFAATKSTTAPISTPHTQAQPTPVFEQQQQQHQHLSLNVYGAQCYVCMSLRPAVECVSCARSTCEHCARQCTRCGLLACALCSQVSYAARFEQTFCFDCFRAAEHRPSPPRSSAAAAASGAATTTTMTM
jgi:hypothetical protein